MLRRSTICRPSVCVRFALTILASLVCARPAPAADASDVSARLTLKNQDVYQGQLLDCDQVNVLRWQTHISDEPLDFPIAAVNAVYRDRGDSQSSSLDEDYLELTGGDVLFGQLQSVTEDLVRLETSHFGEVGVPLSQVARIFLGNEGGNLAYFGPNGLAGWNTKGEENRWRDEGGHLFAEGNAQIEREFTLPARACFEVTLGLDWATRFTLTVGDQFQLATVGRNVVLIRESETKADIAKVYQLESGRQSLRLQIYLDQPRGEVRIFSIEGEELAKVVLPGKESASDSLFTLSNDKGSLTFEQLIVRGWNGVLPGDSGSDSTIVHMADGANRKVDQMNIVPKEVVLDPGQDSEERIAREDVIGISFAHAAPAPKSSLRIILRDGTRLSGDLQKVRQGHLQLKSPSVVTMIEVPVSEVDSLVGLAEHSPRNGNDRTRSLLETDQVTSRGTLVENPPDDPPGSLYWRSFESPSIVKLRSDISGQINMDWPKDPKKVSPQTKAQANSPVGQFFQQGAQLLRQAAGARPASDRRSAAPVSSAEVLILWGGDRFICHVESMDEKFVRFTSDLVEVTSLPQSTVKAWQHSSETRLDHLAESKRERLMTLPRMQRNSPPTHMIESRNGDFLRGRLLEMNEQFVLLEVRLENKKIDRKLIRRIVWLANESGEEEEEVPTSQVQAINHNGVCLTFSPAALTDGVLTGESQLLGPCHIKLSQIKRLLLGSAIGDSANEFAGHQWALKDARDPLFVNADGSPSGGEDGTQTSMVGNDAPDFTLDLLAGGKFHLHEQRGQVVVLDFWASWCGPCVQAMPQIDAVVNQFEGKEVRLVSVNLQEDQETVRSMLERLEISPEVALDIDGATAEKYQVLAIPQTVVIDRDGKVGAVFIGEGPRFSEQLHEAIQRAVEPPEEP